MPDLEIFELTAAEAVELDEDLIYEGLEFFPLAAMSSREREKLISWAIAESGATGGWFRQPCFPGCLPDGAPIGPFPSAKAALADARAEANE